MCSHFRAPNDRTRVQWWSGVQQVPDDLGPGDVWPLYRAPIMRRDPDDEQARQVVTGQFGLLAHWAKDANQGRKTYNARGETVAEKPTYRDAWRRGQRCVIPAEWIYEPSWETGKAVPWKIQRSDMEPLGIAGLWSTWRPAGGGEVLTFTMLTVNATSHPLMRRFHRPDDEKRMVVILAPGDYDRWLGCPLERQASFLQQYPAELLQAEAAPPSPRKHKAEADDVQRDLL